MYVCMMRSALVTVPIPYVHYPSNEESRDVFLGPKVLGLAFQFLDDEGEGLRVHPVLAQRD